MNARGRRRALARLRTHPAFPRRRIRDPRRWSEGVGGGRRCWTPGAGGELTPPPASTRCRFGEEKVFFWGEGGRRDAGSREGEETDAVRDGIGTRAPREGNDGGRPGGSGGGSRKKILGRRAHRKPRREREDFFRALNTNLRTTWLAFLNPEMTGQRLWGTKFENRGSVRIMKISWVTITRTLRRSTPIVYLSRASGDITRVTASRGARHNATSTATRVCFHSRLR